jgi:hypothetical protein
MAEADRLMTSRQKEVLDHIMLTGESPYVAAKSLRTAPRNIYRILSYPHVKKEMQRRVLDHVGILSLYATRCQEQLLRSDSDHVRAIVCENILNRQLGKPVVRQQISHQGDISVSIDLS